MGYFEHNDRLKRLDGMIRRQGTGSANKMTKTLCVSRRTVFEDLKILRSYGAVIKFNMYKKTYYYENAFRLNL